MSTRFFFTPNPEPLLLDKVAALAPTNPFATKGYVAYRAGFGAEPWVIGVERDEHLVAACVAFARSGHLNRSLEVTSLPELPNREVFWNGLLELCAHQGVSQLMVCSFGSTASSIPALAGEERRQSRYEFVLDLKQNDRVASLTTHHRRKLDRARKRGLVLQRVTNRAACDTHVSLIQASMQRREDRGEQVPNLLPDVRASAEFAAMIQSGIGELFQAVDDGQVVSSIMVLRSARGGYLQTSGNSPLGMTFGASTWLVLGIANELQSDGLEQFNLGGAGAGPEEEGLRRFKAGFGATAIPLESATFFLASPVKQAVSRVARRLRQAIGH